MLENSTFYLYANPAQISASAPMNASITVNHKVVNTESIVRVKFTTAITIPAGYIRVVNNAIAPVGKIVVLFETFGSYSADLGMGYTAGQSVPCYGINGLSGTLTCTFTPGDTTLTRYSPALVTVTGFNEIAAGTTVELHLPKVKNPDTAAKVRRIGLSVSQTNNDDTEVGLYDTAYFVPDPVGADTSAAITAATPALDPNTRGTLGSLGFTGVTSFSNFVATEVKEIVLTLPSIFIPI